MAVTFTDTPDDYSLSGNPLVFVFRSNEAAAVNFRFKVEVQVNSTTVETHTVFGRLEGSFYYGYFDATSAMERVLSSRKINTTSTAQRATNDALLRLRVTEVFGSPLADGANATSTNISVFKGRLPRKNWTTYDATDFIYGSGKKWFTDFPRDEKRWFDFTNTQGFFTLPLLRGASVTAWAQIVLYDAAGAEIKRRHIPTNMPAKVSQVSFNYTMLTTSYNQPTAAFTDADVRAAAYADVRIVQNTLETFFEVYRVWNSAAKCQNDYATLIFINQYGAWEAFEFIRPSRFGSSVSTEEYRKQFGMLDGTNFTFDLQDTAVIVKEFEDTLTLKTDNLRQGVQNWLVRNLINSPRVLLLTDVLQEVTVSTNGYTYKRNDVDQVFSEEITIKLGRDYTTTL
jgi:hypothetical protein